MHKIWLLALVLLLASNTEAALCIKKKKRPAKKQTHSSSHRKKKKRKQAPPPPPPKFDFSVLNGSSNAIEGVFYNNQSAYNNVLAAQSKHRLQIIYTRIDRDINNVPHFTEYTYNVNPYVYFYPASCVKLPLSALALEKVNSLNIEGLAKETHLTVDSANTCQYPTYVDSTSADLHASIGHYIKKILLVSDNDAYNKMFEWNGTGRIHQRLKELKLPDVRITHRFFWCNNEANRYTNPFNFYSDSGSLIYRQEMLVDTTEYIPPIGKILLGDAYIDFDGKLKKYPKDFTDRNYFKLADIDLTLKKVMFPELYKKNETFDLTERDYRFMRKYMSMYATESINPVYDTAHGYFDCIKKYLIYGQNKDTVVNKNLRIFNIVGFSYGFLTDCAYIVDFETNTEFIVSATIYSNEANIMNSGKYEYYTVGMPFLKQLGLDILKLEQSRPKKFVPNLDYLKFDYTRPN
jgi:hypothetical protein